MSEIVYVTLDGKKYTGWEDISVKRSIEALASSFDISVTDKNFDFIFKPGMSCTISAGVDTLLTGYVNVVSPSVDGETHQVKISGRCKSQDLVDCSAMNKPGHWSQPIGLQKLIYELVKPFGIRVGNDAGNLGENVRNFGLNSGESPFEAMQRELSKRSLIVIANEEGDLVITPVGKVRSTDNLVYGINILKASGSFSDSDRYSLYAVKGSATSEGDGWGATNVEVYGEATDPAVNRYRPKLISAEGQANINSAKIRAAWEAQTRAGKSGELTVTVQGWRQTNGSLWKENLIVNLDILPLRVSKMDMVVGEIEYAQSAEGGTLCTMTLRRPETYEYNPPKSVKKPKKPVVWE
jgi:prophage tail gpP-like protein